MKILVLRWNRRVKLCDTNQRNLVNVQNETFKLKMIDVPGVW